MNNGGIDAKSFFDALELISKDRGIHKEKLCAAVENALISAYKKNFNNSANVRATVDPVQKVIELYAVMTVVDEVEDPQSQISLEKAREIRPQYEIGDIIEVETMPRNFGRIAAMAAKQVVVQHLREAERGGVYDEYSQKENEILTAIVQRIDEEGNVYVDLGRTEGVLEIAQQMPGEKLHVNDRVKVYVLDVRRDRKGPQVYVSRSHSGLVKRLFELEVPEIVRGTVQIKAITREAGYRTKMAVFSTDETIDAVGSCVGSHGMRVENVVNELKTEKIDIIKWSSDPAEFIANAINPARVVSVLIPESGEKSARVIVPDNQLSLAIGKEGQNARLAAHLTGWKIDIKSQSQVLSEMVEEAETAEENPTEEA